MKAWAYTQWPNDDVTEVDIEWDYMTGLCDTLPIRTCIPVSPGPGLHITCWPCGLIVPLHMIEVIAPDDTPISASL